LWTDALARESTVRVERWRAAVSLSAGPAADHLLAALRAALADDLDTPAALAAVDAWADAQLATGGDDPQAPTTARDALDALLGIRL
jgi:L-cysteine:1D-myo-inositol 2-amino-2-deoxy-alpha-D-glucopyranoside ligase